MRRFPTLMTSVRVEIRQNLWQVRFVLLRMLWSANLKAGGFLLALISTTRHTLKGEISFLILSSKYTLEILTECYLIYNDLSPNYEAN